MLSIPARTLSRALDTFSRTTIPKSDLRERCPRHPRPRGPHGAVRAHPAAKLASASEKSAAGIASDITLPRMSTISRRIFRNLSCSASLFFFSSECLGRHLP